MNQFIKTLRSYFKKWFHKRNIIIVSERKVKHIPISGGVQFSVLILMAASVCWASYSTGSFMAARMALREQGQTLRSVANARVETNFNTVFHPSPASDTPSDVQVPPAPNDPSFTLSALDQDKLYARIAFLEYKVAELKNTNESIIQRVRDKTSGRIDELETIIKQTGLSADSLKKQVTDSNKTARSHRAHVDGKAEGGPYIPAEPIHFVPGEATLYDNLDRLAVLRQIVGNLPLAMPIHDAERESPFGHRIDPFNGHLAFHSGLDLAGPAGSKIYAPADGKVVETGPFGGYGNAIDIDHGFGIVTRYGHLSAILVKEGQAVHKGDIIGIQGSTGRSTGAHLHYEVRYHNQPMNPEKFLQAGEHVSEED